jgi:hypothetical protein
MRRKEFRKMKTIARKWTKASVASLCAVTMALMCTLGMPGEARADEADAKRLLKAMSDYMAAQKALSFGFDATLEVITKDNQKLALASSGTVILDRPGKIRAPAGLGMLRCCLTAGR